VSTKRDEEKEKEKKKEKKSTPDLLFLFFVSLCSLSPPPSISLCTELT
jgi:hypothetical protein